MTLALICGTHETAIHLARNFGPNSLNGSGTFAIASGQGIEIIHFLNAV